MAEFSTPEERTEEPTDRRMGQLRKEGSIHFSSEVAQVLSMITGFLVLKYICAGMFENLKIILIKSYTLIGSRENFTPESLRAGFVSLVTLMVPDMLILAGSIAVVASFAVLYQTKFNIKERKIDFKAFHLNPLQGIKRIFSIQGVITTLKAIVKLAIILPIGYFALKRFAPTMIELVHFSISDTLAFTSDAMSTIFWRIAYVLMVIAAFDYFWGKHQWLKQNRMTKAEVKDERKSIEGDEATRRKIQAKGIQRILQRLKSAVPKADVVVTNPTHYSVALKYDRNTMTAPTVVAKGKGHMALRIRQIAKEHGVPVLERKPLARALFSSTEVGSQIPRELFRAVAEVLAYVYRLRGRNSAQQQVAR
ncbi:MAG: flagellar biosynthesis protein FlhB [Oligoflexia bacterium]|nr:flagellar biosynthesis protein FlhB [Oligoflexia bacterium]